MDRIKKYIANNKKIAMIALAVMVLSLPFIINQVLKRQDLRQRAQVAPSISFNLSPNSKNVAINEEFDVDLMMDAGTNDIGAVEFTINYPSSTLQLVSDTPLSPYIVADKQVSAGTYKATLLNITSTPVTGNDIKIVTLKFKGLANGSANVKIDPATLQVTASGSDQFVPVSNADNIQSTYTVGQVAGATLSFSPASGNVVAGQNLVVQARINTPQSVNAVQLVIQYPENLLDVVSTQVGEFTIEAPTTDTGGILTLPYGSISALSGDRLVATITFKGLAAGTANVSFTNASEALSSATNQNIIETRNGATYTVTGTGVTPPVSPTPTNTPTPTPTRTPTPTPTRTPTPTNTPSPTPTTIPQTQITVSLKLPGIGLVVGDNTNPKNSTRTVLAELFNSSNQSVAQVSALLTYSSTVGRYNGTITLGSGITSGSYLLNVKFANTLAKRVPGIINIVQNSTVNTAPFELVLGDLQNNNSLDISDWTNMVACIRNEAGCTSAIRIAADLNDDAVIDIKDVQLLQVGFATRSGD